MNKIIPFFNTIHVEETSDCSKLIPEILKIKEKNSGVNISNIGGWQSNAYNYPDHVFMQSIIREIHIPIRKVYDEMGITDDVRLINYWFNVNDNRDYNQFHDHPFSYFSACLYVKIPENSGNIVFERPDPLKLCIWTQKNNEHNRGMYIHQPVENTIVIFPSFIKHCVEQNMSDESRISIAFNFA
jgi:uncharacterized protein (TIGR02466 family)